MEKPDLRLARIGVNLVVKMMGLYGSASLYNAWESGTEPPAESRG